MTPKQAKPKAGRVRAAVVPKYRLVLVSGVEGPSIYLNEYRIAGPKPWGGGTTLHEFTAAQDDILHAMGITLAKPGRK